MNKFCELCDEIATAFDRDLRMYLCDSDFKAFNPRVTIVEFDEVWED